MKRARFTEKQIIGISQENEAGAKCPDLCRKHGMSEGTFYAWKSKFGGMTVSDAIRLKALKDENGKLNRLLTDRVLDMSAMRKFPANNFWGLLFSARQLRICRPE